MWKFYASNYEADERLDQLVVHAIEIRNRIAHGQMLDLS
jgi:hypothetical protein